ncbi:uncharacterized mitochondrial protein AtMg00240-like [Vigna umbellata]|uniref:uncharacterized mitochondrial protein AtMg00240-like n=1 Tax=Vigna umbellata TaxID=87088 RepID=UPI001F5E7D09|nr:uncharacterized mitochondrial protein AtMg00240-like [Vigna umbellata]
MEAEFEMTNLGKLSYFLAKSLIEINLKLTKGESEENADETMFKQISGTLRFLYNSRPYLSFSVGLVSSFMSSPKKSHMLVVKRLYRYIQGTTNYGVLFPTGKKKLELELIAFTDSDCGGDPVERKRTYGYVFMLNDRGVLRSNQ